MAWRNPVEDVAIKNTCCMEKKAKGDCIVNCAVRLLARIKKAVWLLAAIVVDFYGVVRADTIIRMLIEKIDLPLKLVGRGPVIVPLKNGKILPIKRPKSTNKISLR